MFKSAHLETNSSFIHCMLWTTHPKYGIGPHQMEITKRSNNHSFTECSRGPVENLIKGPHKDVLQCPSSKLYRLSWCPICQSLSWHLMPSLDAKIMYVKYQQMNSGREFFWEQSKTTHFVPFPGWEHEVIMRKFHIWNLPDAQDPKHELWMCGPWQQLRAVEQHCSCRSEGKQVQGKNIFLCLVHTCHSLLV